ncbi:oligosaccharide biosynthesis protein Alg14 like domain-containing protein [Trichoderma longibrachiatum]
MALSKPAILIALSAALLSSISSPLLTRHRLLTIVALTIALLIFTTTRHIQLLSHRNRTRRAALQPPINSHHQHQNDPSHPPPTDYTLFVLGSGGHTKEMLMMMDDGTCDFRNTHRRYLLSRGDSMSEHHLADYEARLRALCEARGTSPGTHDVRAVTRARRVHQPLWSTPLTALRSIADIFPALLAPPPPPPDNSAVGRRLRYPRRVFSNGPATGFFVALAVHLLKMAYVVPESCCKVIYIESWARISTLSLTGKLLLYTGIADVFVTQHQEVATQYGVQNAGEIVFNSRRLDDIEPSPAKC